MSALSRPLPPSGSPPLHLLALGCGLFHANYHVHDILGCVRPHRRNWPCALRSFTRLRLTSTWPCLLSSLGTSSLLRPSSDCFCYFLQIGKALCVAAAVAVASAAPAWKIIDSDIATIDTGLAFTTDLIGYSGGASNGVGPAIFKTVDGEVHVRASNGAGSRLLVRAQVV